MQRGADFAGKRLEMFNMSMVKVCQGFTEATALKAAIASELSEARFPQHLENKPHEEGAHGLLGRRSKAVCGSQAASEAVGRS